MAFNLKKSSATLFSFLILTGLALPVLAAPVQGIHREIESDMESEEKTMLPLMDILWKHTLLNSPSLQLAIEKMAEKTGAINTKTKIKWTDKLLQNMVQLGGLGGAVALGNPAPLIGSNFVGHMTAKDGVSERMGEVTSADLVILGRQIEDIQSKLIQHYMNYVQAREATERLESDLAFLQNQVYSQTREPQLDTDTLHSLILNQQLQVEQSRLNVETYRNLLVLNAGEKAMEEVDRRLAKTVTESSHHQTEAPASRNE